MLTRGWLTAVAGALFVTLSVWPSHAADGLGVVPQVEVAHAAEFRNQADRYAAGSVSPDAVPWGGDLRVVSVVVTQVSAAERVVTVELFPQEIALRPGDGVLWVNVVPGAILRVVFQSTAPVVGTCTTPTPIAARSSLSTLVAEGTAGVHCFLAPGIFPYRVVIMMPDAEVALPGVVVVEE